MSDDNIVLFPQNRIVSSDNANKQVSPEEHKKLVMEQTKEFVEASTDDIAYMLLDKFLNAGINTKVNTFTQDLALVMDTIRGLLYRDFKTPHPAQVLSDTMVTVKQKSGGQLTARLDYSSVIEKAHKPHKPLSDDVEQEVSDINEDGIDFFPDFEPDNDK